MDNGTGRFDRFFPLIYVVVYTAVALAVQLTWFPIGDIGTETDFYADFALAAQRLCQGEFSVLNYPFKGPVTSFALAGVHALVSPLGGDWYRSGVTLNLICAALFLMLLYRMLLRTFNRRVAVCATVGVSLAFEFFLHAHKATSDLLFLLICYLALERLTARDWTLRRLAVAGALGGLAFLTRYNGLIVPLGGLVIVLLVNRDRRTWRHRLLGAAAHLAAFLVVIAPWYAVNLAQTGRLLATRNLQNIFVAEFYEPDGDADAPADRPDSLAGVIRRDPLRVAGRYLANVHDHLRQELESSLDGDVTVLLVLGLGRMLIFPPRRRHWAFLVYPLMYFLVMCTVYYQPRFGFSVWPGWFAVGYVALAGDGVDRRGRLGDRLARVFSARVARVRERLPRATAMVVLAVALSTISVIQVVDIVEAERFYYQRMPLFVLDLAPTLKHLAGADADAVVMSRKPHLAHYAGLTHLPYPPELTDAEDFFAFAVEHHARFIVYSDIERSHYPPSLFLDKLSRYAGLELVYRDDAAEIYELDAGLTAAEAAANKFTADMERRLVGARERGDAGQIFRLDVLAAEALARDGDMSAAAVHLESALALAPADDSPEIRRAVANTRLNLGQLYLKLERDDEGIALLGPALPEIAAILPPDRQALAHVCLAEMQEHVGRLDLARLHLEHAHDICLAAGDVNRARNVRQRLESLH